MKWVNSIQLVKDDLAATQQMREFALRTHQGRVPELAAEYRPAFVERSAVPIRVEKWRHEGVRRYRIVGLDWGGDRARGRLQIRFRPGTPWENVSEPAEKLASQSWKLWEHDWRPTQPGPYLLQLRVEDATLATNRFDASHFVRAVRVEEI